MQNYIDLNVSVNRLVESNKFGISKKFENLCVNVKVELLQDRRVNMIKTIELH